jgi:hypothetical protein
MKLSGIDADDATAAQRAHFGRRREDLVRRVAHLNAELTAIVAAKGNYTVARLNDTASVRKENAVCRCSFGTVTHIECREPAAIERSATPVRC